MVEVEVVAAPVLENCDGLRVSAVNGCADARGLQHRSSILLVKTVCEAK